MLVARSDLQRRELAISTGEIAYSLRKVDAVVGIARRVATHPLLLAGALAAVVAVIRPRRLLQGLTWGLSAAVSAQRVAALLRTSALMAVMLLATAASAQGEDVTAVAKPRQYVYVLRLVPRLHDDAAWTETDKAAVSQHFRRLQQATAEGRVILAGRTTEAGDKTFGLVIFEATDDDAAQQFMQSDPAVVAGVMGATLHPYAVALQRPSPK
jgi:uncharacterized protein